MSRKKLIMASAILSVAALAASCGGGGGGTPAPAPSSGGGTGGGGGGTVTTEAQVIASVSVGASGVMGVNNKYAQLTLKSDGSIDVSYLPDTGIPDAPLYKIHTFANGNHLLQDDANNLYLFNGSTITPLTNIGGPGITWFDAVRAKYVVLDQNNNQNADAIITQNGNVIKFTDNSVRRFAEDFIVADCNTNTSAQFTAAAACVIKADGTIIALSSNQTIANTYANGYLVQLADNMLYLITDEGQAVLINSTLAGAINAPARTFPVVKSGSDYYVAYDDGGNVQYHKVSGGSLVSGWSAGALQYSGGAVPNTVSYALDASGRLFVLNSVDNSLGPNAYAVYTAPNSYIRGSAGANVTFDSTADILFIGDGIAYVSSADGNHTVAAKIFAGGGGVTAFTAIPSGLDSVNSTVLSSAALKVLRRNGNELLVIADNYDAATGSNDAFYLKLDSTNAISTSAFAEMNLYSNPNIRTLLGSPLVVADYNANISSNYTLYKCSISSTPCTALSNVKLTDLDTNLGGGNWKIVYAQGREITDGFNGAINPAFTLYSPVLLVLDAQVGAACANGTFTPTLINLDADKKQSFTAVNFQNCVQRQAFGNVQINPDGTAGKRVYGQNPAGSTACLNTGGFANIVLVKPDGTTKTYELAKQKGLCFLSAIDVK